MVGCESWAIVYIKIFIIMSDYKRKRTPTPTGTPTTTGRKMPPSSNKKQTIKKHRPGTPSPKSRTRSLSRTPRTITPIHYLNDEREPEYHSYSSDKYKKIEEAKQFIKDRPDTIKVNDIITLKSKGYGQTFHACVYRVVLKNGSLVPKLIKTKEVENGAPVRVVDIINQNRKPKMHTFHDGYDNNFVNKSVKTRSIDYFVKYNDHIMIGDKIHKTSDNQEGEMTYEVIEDEDDPGEKTIKEIFSFN